MSLPSWLLWLSKAHRLLHGSSGSSARLLLVWMKPPCLAAPPRVRPLTADNAESEGGGSFLAFPVPSRLSLSGLEVVCRPERGERKGRGAEGPFLLPTSVALHRTWEAPSRLGLVVQSTRLGGQALQLWVVQTGLGAP